MSEPRDFGKVEELYHAALARGPSERDVFLKEACGGDEGLLREVKSLLGYEEEAKQLLEEPAAKAATQKLAVVRGTRLGPYEVQELIGAGGMGEVYRARDPRLGREIAIKVLSPHRAQDRNARARFEREARTASALHHPYIVNVYEIGEADTPAGPTYYIAMELVEGQTLRERLSGGAGWKDLVGPLAQVADALAKAHKAGIIHRDLKPENIILTPDGYPKVLDFGLAKLMESGDPASVSESVPTRSFEGHTRAGTIIGTPGYMSPEQVQGKPLDPRSDIFSFGCILYEAATARRPFKGDSQQETLRAIVYDEPPTVESLGEAPPELGRLIRKCLAKAPEQRYQAIADVAHDLRDFGHSGPTTSPVAGPASAPGGGGGRRASTRVVWAAAGFLALVALGIGLGLRRTPREPQQGGGPSTQSRLHVEAVTNRGDVLRSCVSPDGRYLAYASGSFDQPSIYLRDIAERTESRLAGPLDVAVEWIDFSREGRVIYFLTRDRDLVNALYKIPLIGGQPQLLQKGKRLGWYSPDWTAGVGLEGEKSRIKLGDLDGSHPRDLGVEGVVTVFWAPDSKRLYFLREREGRQTLYVIDRAGTGERKVAELPEGYVNDDIAGFRPDGRILALWLVRGKDPATRRLHAIDVTAGTTAPIGDIAWDDVGEFLWLPDGSGFIATRWDTQAKRFEMCFVSYPEGQVRPAVPDGTEYSRASLTADGTKLVAIRTVRSSDLVVSANGEKGPFLKIATITAGMPGLCWTSDSKIVLSSNDAGSYDLYVMDPDGSNRRQLTFDKTGNELDPAASPDGRYLVYVLEREGEGGLYRIDRDGSGPRRLTVARQKDRDRAPWVTRDGRQVLYSPWNNGPALYRVPIDGGEPVRIIGPVSEEKPAPGERGYGGSDSPDGRKLAFFYSSPDPAKGLSPMELVISDPDGRLLRRYPHYPEMLVGENNRVRWSSDGKALYYQDLATHQLCKRPLAGGPATQVTSFDGDIGAFAFSFDGKWLACERTVDRSDAVMITGFR